ncbi:alkene reductase [Croceiramulus getboli]|nr:alkene reductase [Flavobacteriaceae bacterium YJPT1-3]
MKTDQPLLQSIQLGAHQLKNRVVMAPMTRNRADNPDCAPTQLHATYYAQRAGAGLIISEGSQVSKRARGYIHTAGIHSRAQIEGWKDVTRAVHDKDGKIFCQLWHVGAISHPDFHDGNKPIAPSAVNPNTQCYTASGFKDTVEPKAMTLEEIQETEDEFYYAAMNAKEAGFDGIEIHASNGYIFHQFFNSIANVREDDFGGSIENRCRFFFNVLERLRKVWPENCMGVRLNPSLHGDFGITATEDTMATFDYIIKKLNEYDLAYLHLSEPFTDVSDVDFLDSEIAKRYRPIYSGSLMINNGFDKESGNEVIAKEHADLVSFGKLFISNPDLPHRFEVDAPMADWDQDTFYAQGPEGYIDYPTYEQEKQNA